MTKKAMFLLRIALVLFAFFLTGCTSELLSFVPAETAADQSLTAATRALPANVADGSILHAYMWTFNGIKNALPQISSAGYKAVQVSPVQKTKGTGQWYLLYQPCNFDIGNTQLGTYDEFVSLCSTANNYGIKIIVDAVLNHVADNGTSGQWDNAVDASLKNSSLYHNLGSIGNYQNRYEVTQKNLGNGPDLYTQHSDVQTIILNFLNKAVAAGAGGFRFDAAKHIETNSGEDAGQSWSGSFWTNILAGLNNAGNLYLYGEVLPDLGDNDEAYLNLYDITTHGYLWTLSDAFNNGNLTGIATINHYNHSVAADKALVYAENHDTYEHGESSGFSYWKRKAMYAILIARAGMTPLILDRPTDDIWSDSDIAALNNFRNEMVGLGEYLRFPSNPVLIIERGTKGVVIVNVGGGASSINSPTNLAVGSYSSKSTTAATFTSSGGNLTGTIPANSVIVLYQDGLPGVPSNVQAAAASSSSITVTWAASANANTYTVYRSSTSGGSYSSVGTTTGTSFTNTGLTANTTYYYKVSATNAAGSSAQSAYASATTLTTGGYTSPYTSMYLRGTMNAWGSNAMTLVANNTWEVSVDLLASTTYQYKYDAYANWASSTNWGDTNNDGVAAVGSGNISYTTAAAGSYKFRFVDNTLAYSVTAPNVSVPAVPTGVSASAASSSIINVSWSASTGATSYTVYRSATSGGTYSSVGTSTSTSFSNTGLAANTTYYYKVAASNSAGSSAQSAAVSATTLPSSTVTTTLRVHYDTGVGNNITIRGSVSPLSWTTGAAATWTIGNVWVWTTTGFASGASFEYKPLINDSRWSDGANYVGTGGATLDIYPTFNGNFYDIMDNIATNWSVSGGSGTYKWHQASGFAEVNNASTESQLTLIPALNKTGSTVTLAFKYKVTGLDSGEYLAVDVLKGSTWNQIAVLTGTAAWVNVSYDITAYGSTAMKLRFRAKMNEAGEVAGVDNVTVSVK